MIAVALLLLVSLVWAFSFSVIGKFLNGSVDSYIALFLRIAIAAFVFYPFSRSRKTPFGLQLKIGVAGFFQVGLMYLFFYQAFHYLSVRDLILNTVVTPFYILLIANLFERKFRLYSYAVISLAILAGVVLRFKGDFTGRLFGILLMQLANLSFAIGQVYYRRLKISSDQHSFYYFFLGALVATFIPTLLLADFTKLPRTLSHLCALLWLGVVASGGCYLLWNRYSKKVSAATLAVMNNAVIPLGIVVSVLFFHQEVSLLKISAGSIIWFAALYLTIRGSKRVARSI